MELTKRLHIPAPQKGIDPQTQMPNSITAIHISKLCIYIHIVLFFIFMPLHGWSDDEVKIFIHKIDQPFSGSQAPDDAYMAAITRAKFEVLEKAGTYLESQTEVINAVLTEDEITALAGGIMKSEVTRITRYANEHTFGFKLTIKIEVDNSILKKRMNKLLKDRSLLKKYNEIHQREQELLAQIQCLEQLNAQLAAQQDHAQRQPGKNNFTKLSAALSSSQWVEKALSYWENEHFSNPKQAELYLDKAILLDNKNPRLYNSRAVAYLDQHQPQKALDDLNTALQLDPEYSDAYNDLGSLYYMQHEYEKAVIAHGKAIAITPDNVEALLNRGMAFRKLYKFEKAFDDFGRAMNLAPQNFKKLHEGKTQLAVNEIVELCKKSKIACKMGLCRSLTYLQERGFCETN